MNTNLFTIAGRNLKLFFRDRASVFFSVLAIIIIIGLYILFLGNVVVSGSEELLGEHARFVMDSWIMSGVIAVAGLTTSMGAFGTFVADRERKIMKDFFCAPVKRPSIVGGYVVSAYTVGVIMSIVALVLAQIYITAYGGSILSAMSILKIFAVILLSTFASSAMVFFLVTFFKSNNAFAVASTVLGTLVGFVTGSYIPIGQMPAAVQMVIKCFPVSHAAVLMKQIMMAEPLRLAFANAPPQAVSGFKLAMGVEFEFGSVAPPVVSVIVLLATGLAFYALAVVRISRRKAL